MNQPIFVLIISKISPSCNKILPLITEIVQNQFPLQILDIDNPQTRSIVIKTNQVQTVPCLALKNGENIQWFEREKVLEILNFIKSKIGEKQGTTDKVTILDDLPQDVMSVNDVQDEPVIDLKNIKQIQTKKTNKKAHEMLRGRSEMNPSEDEIPSL